MLSMPPATARCSEVVRAAFTTRIVASLKAVGALTNMRPAATSCGPCGLHRGPCAWGGAWGVGCKFCDFLRQRRLDAKDDARREGNAKPKRRRGPNDANTRWARFEIRSEEQIACRGVRQHSETQQHRIAARVYLSPDSAVTVLEPTAADAELFRGSVPQLDDWLLAWRACRTPQSFYAAEAHGVTCNYIRGSRMQRTSRKAFKSMVDVMAMALRERKKDASSRGGHHAGDG